MAIYKYGNMWEVFPDKTDVFIITTNSYIKKDGSLVMGRGIAKQVRDTFEDIDKDIGNLITHMSIYGFIPAKKMDGCFLGVFQVKKHFRNKAKLDLIERSVEDLKSRAENNPETRFDLNFPGIGNGNRSIAEVKPILSNLPENVRVWAFENQKSEIERL